MKKLYLIFVLFFGLNLFCKAQTQSSFKIDYSEINSIAAKESLLPIRAGSPGEKSFWNKYSKRFTCAPVFDVNHIAGVSKYKFVITVPDSSIYTFTSENPNSNLSPIWSKIPVGHVNLKIISLDTSGKEMKLIFNRDFERSPIFQGPYQNPSMDYVESAKLALKYLYDKPYIQSWAYNNIPDTLGYHLYCYPAKIISAVTELMLNYAKLSHEDYQKAMKIARNAADYLINVSEPQDAPLAYFPPTYAGVGDQRDTAPKKFHNQFMIIYPAQAACIYLDLYDVTKNNKYKEAALRIASTYKKIQETSGTWKLRIWNTGKPVADIDCIPTVILQFFDRLISQYNVKSYESVRDKAYKWIMDNPMKSYNWSGQFEDQNPLLPYQDLTKDDAVNFAMILLDQSKTNKSYMKEAEELLRFSEDQFVLWNKVNKSWPTPSALEQYFCYTPINASVACMIDGYISAYRATKKSIYLAKAIALANSVTTTQHSDGRYPTFWRTEDQNSNPDEYDWLNCSSYTVRMMLALNKLLVELNQK